MGLSSKVDCEIPVKRYPFFESLEYKLLPDTKIELNVESDKDQNLIWRQGGADGAGKINYTTTSTFCSTTNIYFGRTKVIYLENYLKPYKWTYLNENFERSNNSKQKTGHFRITNGISKPRHVFVFIVNTVKFRK